MLGYVDLFLYPLLEEIDGEDDAARAVEKPEGERVDGIGAQHLLQDH